MQEKVTIPELFQCLLFYVLNKKLQFLKSNSLLFQVAKYYTSKKNTCPDCILAYFNQILHKETPQNTIFPDINKRAIASDFFDHCPGWIKVSFQKNQNQENEVRYLSIVFPWSLDALYKSHYLQFDASFHAMKPYAYSITHGIIFNESVPLSITLAPTESEELYQMIINHFNELSKNKFSWNSLPVLSDMGTSIKSVCKKNNIKQVFCHRHILEHFGSATVLAIFCNRLLSSYSFHEYLQISMNVKCELDEFIKEKKKLGKLSIDFLSKVNDLQVMLDGENGDQESNYYYTKWAIWVRREFHICRCSNHIESFHGVLNRSLGLQRSFKKKFSNLIETTLLHFSNLSKRFGSSIIRKSNSLKEMISKKLSNLGFDVMSLCCTACDCEEDIYNSMIFGCEIRCQHQMLLPARDILEKLIKKIEKYNKENNADKEININNFIKIIIDQKGFINQAMNDFIPDVNQLFLVFKGQECLTYDDLVDLIKSLHLCFKYVNPEFPKISEDNKIHKKEEYFMDDYVQIDAKNSNNPTLPKELSKEDEEFWIQNTGSANHREAKKAMFDTIKEIIFVYPCLRNSTIPYGICFDQYNHFLSYNAEKEILNWIPKFKIACWKATDKLMKNNRFFK